MNHQLEQALRGTASDLTLDTPAADISLGATGAGGAAGAASPWESPGWWR